MNGKSHQPMQSSKQMVSLNNLGEILSTSINNAISTVVMIGGFVVLFSVIISILTNSHMLDMLCNIINPFLDMFNIPKDFSLRNYLWNNRTYKWCKKYS